MLSNIAKQIILSSGGVRKFIVLSNLSVFRNYSNYHEQTASEYDFLHAYNYVGNRGVYWTHPESSIIMRITDDYEQCVRGNRINDNTCWWYFSKRTLPLMMKDFNTQEVIDIKEELLNWKLIQSAPRKYFEWSTDISRIYAAIPNVPYEQKVFAVKQFAATFYTDDSIENLNSNPDYNAAADELATNLLNIWSGRFDNTTDMNQFRGQNNIQDIFIDNATRAIEIQKEFGTLAQRLLKPKIYEMYNTNSRHYLSGCLAERSLFQKHVPNKTFIPESDGAAARILSIGVKWILAANMTDESDAIYISPFNPLNDSIAWIVATENDLSGYCKDKGRDFSPMSICNQLIQSGKTELEAARIILNRTNEAKRSFDVLWSICTPQLNNYYEYLARYSMLLIDYNFCTGLRKGNARYGWIPNLDTSSSNLIDRGCISA